MVYWRWSESNPHFLIIRTLTVKFMTCGRHSLRLTSTWRLGFLVRNSGGQPPGWWKPFLKLFPGQTIERLFELRHRCNLKPTLSFLLITYIYNDSFAELVVVLDWLEGDDSTLRRSSGFFFWVDTFRYGPGRDDITLNNSVKNNPNVLYNY